jgi:hypothetical protein
MSVPEPTTKAKFHEVFNDLVAGLPPSQLKEARKRLTTCKQPLTDEELASEHPRVQAGLEKIAAAYARKKVRSAASSKARRDASRHDTGCQSEEATDVVSILEACTVECAVSEADQDQDQEEPEPEPEEAANTAKQNTIEADVVANPPSSGSAKPLPRRLVRAPPATPPRTAAKKATGNSLVSKR